MKGFKSCFAAALMGLVIFSAGLNASAAEERVIVEDNCDNFENPAIANLTDGKVANMKTADSAMNFHKFQDSTYDSVTDGRMIKAADQNAAETDKSTYIVYHAAENMNSFHVETYYCKKNGKLANDMSFEASSDGVTYTPIPKADITRTVAETTINGNIYNEANWADYFWRQVNFDFSLLPENTHYLKIKFGGKGSNAYYDLAISKVQISTVEGVNKRYLEDAVASARARLEAEKDNCGDGDWQYPQTVYDALENACTAAEAVLQNPEAEQAEVDGARDTLLAQTETFRLSQNHLLPLVDECADFDRLLSYTEANLQLSASDLALGDNTHFARKKEAPAELVYRVTEDVQFIELEAAVRRTQAEIDAGIMAEDMKLSVSANGTDYTALAADAVTVRSIDGGYFDDWVKDTWRRVRYTAFDVPAGTRYVKIAFGAVSDKGAYWENHLLKVTLHNVKQDSVLRGLSLWKNTEAGGVKVTDAAELQAGGSFVLTGNLTIDPSAAPGAALLAVVTDGGDFRGVKILNTAASGRFDFKEENALEVPAGLTQPNIRVFLWDGEKGMKPLAKDQSVF